MKPISGVVQAAKKLLSPINSVIRTGKTTIPPSTSGVILIFCRINCFASFYVFLVDLPVPADPVTTKPTIKSSKPVPSPIKSQGTVMFKLY